MKLLRDMNFQWDDAILSVDVGNIMNKGRTEILGSSKSGKLLLLSLDAELFLEKEISKDSTIWNCRAYDLDKDGENEIISGGMDGRLVVSKYTSNNDLREVWSHRFDSSISGFIIEDINIDGIEEVIAYSLDNTLRVLNSKDGSMIWGQVFENGIGEALVWGNPKNPAKRFIIACGNDGTLRCFDGLSGELSWFKRFTNKVRCVSHIESVHGSIIACGGDDKMLHFIETAKNEEIEYLSFDTYLWKCVNHNNKLYTSSYSFDFLNDKVPIDEIKFNSELVCLDENLEINWELQEKNVECISFFSFKNKDFISVGTTIGEIIVMDANKGTIEGFLNTNYCINDLKFESNGHRLISCNDHGEINAYLLED